MRRPVVLRALLGAMVPLVLLAASVVAGAALLTPAHAGATLGTVTVAPRSGTVDDALSLVTARGCPAGATMSKSRIIGPGFPVRGQNMSGVALGFTSTKKAFKVDAGLTLKDVAALVYPPVTYKGTYRVEVVCLTTNNDDLGHFSSTITFANALQWRATSATTSVKPGPTVSLPSIRPTPAASGSAKPTAKASATGQPSSPPTAGDGRTPAADDPGAGDDPALGSSAVASSSGSSASVAVPALAAAVVGGAVGVGAMAFAQRRRQPKGRREL